MTPTSDGHSMTLLRYEMSGRDETSSLLSMRSKEKSTLLQSTGVEKPVLIPSGSLVQYPAKRGLLGGTLSVWPQL